MREHADKVAAHAEAAFDQTLARLVEYLRYPAISCEAGHADDVRALAARIRDDLEAFGMRDARLLELEGALPCVAAEWRAADEGAPTVLVYGHLDLQPVEGEPWSTPPHEGVVKEGRLYARGSADDMGGWVSHLAAMEAWIAETGGLPCHVKLLIEGEEEIGSPNLERYMDAFPEAFAADVMVLTDCENPSTEIPGLTVSLRGIMELEVRCDALESDVHSGLWGNVVPDPAVALMASIAKLVDEDGRLKVGRQSVDPAWAEAARSLPLTEAVVREGGRVRGDVEPLPERGRPRAEWMWRQPAMTVLSSTLPVPGKEKNAVRASAAARLSLRIAPGQTAEMLRAEVERVLMAAPPAGVKVSVRPVGGAGESWLYTPKGPAFEAADRAYEKAWGAKLVQVGVGGSIPFVALFGRRYGDLPLILNGVMDPMTGAHGPDESLHLGVFQKAILANVYLYAELAEAVSPA